MKKTVKIRPMRKEEKCLATDMAVRSFRSLESLGSLNPSWAYLLEEDGQVIGGYFLEDISSDIKKILYISVIFIRPEYRGQGYGTYLYNELINNAIDLGYEMIVASVRADNIGSWKPLVKRNFHRISFSEIVKKMGCPNFIQIIRRTPFWACIGMDLYMWSNKNCLQSKSQAWKEYSAFYLVNLFILVIFAIFHQGRFFTETMLAGLILLMTMNLTRWIGTRKSSPSNWEFRFANGGILLNLILAASGILYLPVLGSYHPRNFEKNKYSKAEVALAEIILWLVLMGMSLLSLLDNKLAFFIGQMSLSLLLFLIIPFYPFEEFGNNRVRKYSKTLYLVFALLVVLLLLYLYDNVFFLAGLF